MSPIVRGMNMMRKRMILKINGKEETIDYFMDCLGENVRQAEIYRRKEFDDPEFFVDINIEEGEK